MDYLELVENLAERKILKTRRIIEAFLSVNRTDFLPENLKKEAGFDAPAPIGFGQTNSQPRTVAFMLELLQPQAGDKILDIGFGSGWTSALLAYCVGKSGRIYAVEKIPELCLFGKANISKYNFIAGGRVKLACGDGTGGWPAEAPFNRILVSASADKIPQAWFSQLGIDGRMVLPAKNSLWLIIKKGDKKFEEKRFPGFVFVPLVGDEIKSERIKK